MDSKTNFKVYSSIDNRSKIPDKWTRFPETKPDCEFTVQEKVHGSNFSFLVTVSDVGSVVLQCCRRNAILNENEKFYGFERIRDRYRAKILSIWEDLGKPDYMQAYGELFGGRYPGFPVLYGIQTVQQRLWYCQDVDWILFDILVSEKSSCDEADYNLKYRSAYLESHQLHSYQVTRYLEWDQIQEIADRHQVPVPPELYRGSAEDCFKLSEIFLTQIPERYKLPAIETNFAEGLVIRSLGPRKRLIWKKKHPDFQEMANNQKQKAGKKNDSHTRDDKLKDVDSLEMANLCTMGRLESVRSKLPSDTKFGELARQMWNDAVLDFTRIHKREPVTGIRKDIMENFIAPLIQVTSC